MPDCFVYDHVRTPRGRGKPDGALHSVAALELASQSLGAIRERNSLDTKNVDDVVLGCVDPVGEAGGDIARAAALNAGYDESVPGMPVSRIQLLTGDEHLQAAKLFEGHDHASEGETVLMRSPLKLSKAPVSIRSLAPRSGERGASLGAEVGYL